ncbi:hypothetical protein F5B19DRAFT_505098 [Rostrohypoxylon terebratum]|nr:hypothetical protein F5B19DRAFT_505098 [Rostrohypoxylon terebratum]
MASSHDLVGQEMGTLPDYVNRALPPRPDSNTSAHESFDEVAKWASIPKAPIPTSQLQHENINPSSTGIVNEAGMALAHSQVVTSIPPPLNPQKKSFEIAAPQPIYPAPAILTTQVQDIVSPVSAPLSGNPTVINHDQYEVSPLSPTSQHSFLRSPTISEEGSKRISSPTTGDLVLSLSPSNTESNAGGPQNAKKRSFVYRGTHTAHSSGDLAAARLASPHSQVEQIGGRYSDPGSPISGAVIHPPTSFPSDPELCVSRHVDLRDAVCVSSLTPYRMQMQTRIPSQLRLRELETLGPLRPSPPSPRARAEDSPVGAGLLEHTTSGGSGSGSSLGVGARVAFAGPGTPREGFQRARANSKRSAPPPPPLKLSERPIADAYVKTPFPPAPAPMLQRGSSNPTQRTRGAGEERDRDREGGGGGGGGVNVIKKLNRVSSLPGFGFTKSLRRSSTVAGVGARIPEGLVMRRERERAREREKEKGKEKEREVGKEKEKGKEKEGITSPMPKVRNFLERARQMGIGHGLGIGIGSDEARKERRRTEMKRQIHVEPISRDGK